MKLLLSAIILIILLQQCQLNKSAQPPVKDFQSDTLKYLNEFNLLVDSALIKLGNTDQITDVKQAIMLVKISNSIWSYDLSNQEPYKKFETKFDEVYLPSIVKLLDCEISLGMGYASKKYNLIIGGVKYPQNSYIRILELPQ